MLNFYRNQSCGPLLFQSIRGFVTNKENKKDRNSPHGAGRQGPLFETFPNYLQATAFSKHRIQLPRLESPQRTFSVAIHGDGHEHLQEVLAPPFSFLFLKLETTASREVSTKTYLKKRHFPKNLRYRNNIPASVPRVYGSYTLPTKYVLELQILPNVSNPPNLQDSIAISHWEP